MGHLHGEFQVRLKVKLHNFGTVEMLEFASIADKKD